jgi:hypothetical protein
MNYTIRTEYKNGTIEFYYTFSDDNGFIDYLLNKKNLKDNVGALSFALSKAKKTVRVIMPLGTNEKDFNEKMHNFFSFESNMWSMSRYNQNSQYSDVLSGFFGNIFGG